MNKAKKNYDITIFGKKFSIKSDLGDERVFEISKFVNSKIEEVGGSVGAAVNLNMVILACLNITGEYFKLKEEMEEIDLKCRDITQLVDSCLEIK